MKYIIFGLGALLFLLGSASCSHSEVYEPEGVLVDINLITTDSQDRDWYYELVFPYLSVSAIDYWKSKDVIASMSLGQRYRLLLVWNGSEYYLDQAILVGGD